MYSQLERIAWAIIVNSQADMQLIADVSRWDETLAILKMHRPDVVLIDEAILESSEVEALREYSEQSSSSRFVLVALHQQDYSQEQPRSALIHSHLLKGVSAAELLRVIREGRVDSVPDPADVHYPAEQ
jgi:DNA-binding NarL/FixJ family response regulator